MRLRLIQWPDRRLLSSLRPDKERIWILSEYELMIDDVDMNSLRALIVLHALLPIINN